MCLCWGGLWPATVGVCSDTLNSYFQNVSLLGFHFLIPQDKHMNTFLPEEGTETLPSSPLPVVWGLFLYTTESCGQEGDILEPGTKR